MLFCIPNPFVEASIVSTALTQSEKQYKLKEVLSPRAFLSPKERLLPRQDTRKERLKTDIRKTLKNVCHYSEFEYRMQVLGYKVIKGRGISFIDDKKVKIKGSEIGFLLAKIEKILSVRQELLVKQAEQKIYEATIWEDTLRAENTSNYLPFELTEEGLKQRREK